MEADETEALAATAAVVGGAGGVLPAAKAFATAHYGPATKLNLGGAVGVDILAPWLGSVPNPAAVVNTVAHGVRLCNCTHAFELWLEPPVFQPTTPI